jgi:hypothetical protein
LLKIKSDVFFGLFSTHLPYILVGVIYFATFAFASLQALKNEVVEEKQENQTHIIGDRIESLQHTDVYFFDDAPQDYSESSEPSGLQNQPPATVIKLFTSPELPVSFFHPGQLLIRPPPVLA